MPSTDAMRVANEIDIDAVRAATPGCHEVAFLNNAGAALATQRTLDATIGHLLHEAGSQGDRVLVDRINYSSHYLGCSRHAISSISASM